MQPTSPPAPPLSFIYPVPFNFYVALVLPGWFVVAAAGLSASPFMMACEGQDSAPTAQASHASTFGSPQTKPQLPSLPYTFHDAS